VNAQKRVMRDMKPIFIVLVLAVPLLAGCNSGMMAMAPGFGTTRLQAPNIPVKIVKVEAGMPEASARYSDILAREAVARGYAITPAGGATPSVHVKAYLTAYGADGGKTAYSWVLDTSDDGQTRKNRVSGQSILPVSSANGTTNLDESTMRKLAGASLDALTLQLTNPEAASALRAEIAAQDQ
jgi:hypothetical protein